MAELDSESYNVAWIAPLEIEAAAALHMLDHKHTGRFPLAAGDDYVFEAGEMCGHRIIIATLPAGNVYGTGSAAALASQLKKFFPNLWFGLLVGVAAGLPKLSGPEQRDIRLGDVLVALPDGEHPALVPYDLGKETTNGIQLLRSGHALAATEPVVRSAIGSIKLQNDAAIFLPYYEIMKDKTHRNGTFADPGQDNDHYYETPEHGIWREIARPPRPLANRTRVWYGPVGSGEKLLKSSSKRDELRDKHRLIGIEMEAAGTMNFLPVGVIRGVCDYGDEHKNKEWQPYAAAMAAAYAKAILARILPRRSKATEQVFQSSVSQTRIQECLDSLAFPEMDARFNEIDNAARGTCDWLTRDKRFLDWIASGEGILWIKGKPGSGKSALIRYAVKHIESISNPGMEPCLINFFFHGRGNVLERTPLGLFRSLLYQIVQRSPEATADLMRWFRVQVARLGTPGQGWQWHERELRHYFRTALKKLLVSHPVWLFVDALDESGKENAIRLVKDFNALFENVRSDGFRLYICFSCRHYPVLSFDSMSEIWVENENSADISTYIRFKCSKHPDLEQSQIPQLITNNANGIFLWARLAIEQALDLDHEGLSLKMIEKEIKTMPLELDDMYSAIIRSTGDKEASLKLFQWVSFATRPLSVQELRWCMIVEAGDDHNSLHTYENMEDYISSDKRMERRVRGLSCGLIEVKRSQNIAQPRNVSDKRVVQFIHQSVKDFFTRRGMFELGASLLGTNPLKNTINEAVAKSHYRLFRICIQYLNMQEIRSLNRRRPFHSLMAYGFDSWIHHLKNSEIDGIAQEGLLDTFSPMILHFASLLLPIYRDFRLKWKTTLTGVTLAHIATQNRLTGLLRMLLSQPDISSDHLDAQDCESQTPLIYAAQFGDEVSFELLFKSGKLKVENEDLNHRKSLLFAAQIGSHKIARLLLARNNIDVNKKDGLGHTSLGYAIMNDDLEMARLLLSTGHVDLSRNKNGGILLGKAARYGQIDMVELLLGTEKFDVNVKCGQGLTPLSWAVTNNHVAISRRLLEQEDVQIGSRDGRNRTVLMYAAENGNATLFKLLLETNKVEVDAIDQNARTAFWYAAANRNLFIMKLLIGTGRVNLDVADSFGQSPLLWAVEHGDISMTNLLLDTGAVNVTTRFKFCGQTALCWGARSGYTAICGRLLHTDGVDVDARDHYGMTPLLWAARNGHQAIVEILLSTGEVDVNLKNEYGLTALSLSIIKSNETIARTLLEVDGISRDSKDWVFGATPLQWAALIGLEGIVKLLLDSGEADVSWKNKAGSTALDLATENGHGAIIKALLFSLAGP